MQGFVIIYLNSENLLFKWYRTYCSCSKIQFHSRNFFLYFVVILEKSHIENKLTFKNNSWKQLRVLSLIFSSTQPYPIQSPWPDVDFGPTPRKPWTYTNVDHGPTINVVLDTYPVGPIINVDCELNVDSQSNGHTLNMDHWLISNVEHWIRTILDSGGPVCSVEKWKRRCVDGPAHEATSVGTLDSCSVVAASCVWGHRWRCSSSCPRPTCARPLPGIDCCPAPEVSDRHTEWTNWTICWTQVPYTSLHLKFKAIQDFSRVFEK